MEKRPYRSIDVVGTSSRSVEEAMQRAVRSATKHLHYLAWVELRGVRGRVIDADRLAFQATTHVAFRYDKAPPADTVRPPQKMRR